MEPVLVKFRMTSPPILIGPDATIGEAAVLMARRRVRRLLVVDMPNKRGRLEGIVSLHDVARAFPSDLNPLSVAAADGPRIPIHEVMSRRPHTVEPTTSLAAAAQIMNDQKIGALPVVSRGIPVGVITESDIFRAIVEMTGLRHPGTTITLARRSDEDPMDIIRAALSAGLQLESFFSMGLRGRRTVTLRTRGRATAAAVEMLRTGGHAILAVEPPIDG